MARDLVAVDRGQLLLMPPSLNEWLLEDHLVWTVLGAVEAMNLDRFTGSYRLGGAGRPAYDPRLLIHTDPAYVDHDRSNWASYNAGVRGRQCEGGVWYGALHQRLPSGGTVDVFKSWATRRRADPAHILLERRFQHPVINRAAVYSAMKVADSVAPASDTLRSLKARLRTSGLAGISYDL